MLGFWLGFLNYCWDETCFILSLNCSKNEVIVLSPPPPHTHTHTEISHFWFDTCAFWSYCLSTTFVIVMSVQLSTLKPNVRFIPHRLPKTAHSELSFIPEAQRSNHYCCLHNILFLRPHGLFKQTVFWTQHDMILFAISFTSAIFPFMFFKTVFWCFVYCDRKPWIISRRPEGSKGQASKSHSINDS